MRCAKPAAPRCRLFRKDRVMPNINTATETDNGATHPAAAAPRGRIWAIDALRGVALIAHGDLSLFLGSRIFRLSRSGHGRYRRFQDLCADDCQQLPVSGGCRACAWPLSGLQGPALRHPLCQDRGCSPGHHHRHLVCLSRQFHFLRHPAFDCRGQPDRPCLPAPACGYYACCRRLRLRRTILSALILFRRTGALVGGTVGNSAALQRLRAVASLARTVSCRDRHRAHRHELRMV